MADIDLQRRDFLKIAGAAGGLLAAGLPLAAGAQAAGPSGAFDINAQLAEFMRVLGGTPADGGGKVTFTGKDPILNSRFRIGACMAVPAMGAALGAAAIWRERSGETQDLSLDLRQATYGVAPWARYLANFNAAAGVIPPDWLPDDWTWWPTMNGQPPQAPFILGNPLTFGIFDTKDGRKVTPTGMYPTHFNGFLSLIGAPPDRARIAKAIASMDSADLEQRSGDAGLIMGIHRTRAEWEAHPQGKANANVPVVEIVKIGESDPMPWAAGADAPLSGLRVLSNSHVIASTTAARTLAGYGAEALHVARSQGFEQEVFVTDVNVGMRSTMLDLKDPAQNRVQRELLRRTDVLVQGFRGGAMERLGFGPEEVARIRPGIIYLSINAYGFNGPWKEWAGFDMEALTVTGSTLLEGGGTNPRFPPTFVLNDYIAGYMGAAGVIAALRRRAKEGGSYHVRVSLSGCSRWFQDLGLIGPGEFAARGPESRMIPPRTVRGQTPYGFNERLAPMVVLSRTPARWREPLVAVRGGDRPEWTS